MNGGSLPGINPGIEGKRKNNEIQNVINISPEQKTGLLERTRRLKRDYTFEIVKEIEDKRLKYCLDMVSGPDEMIYLPALYSHEILVYNRNLEFVRSFGGKGEKQGCLNEPIALVMLGGTLFVLERGNKRIQKFSPEGKSLQLFSVDLDQFGHEISRIFSWQGNLLLFNKKTHYLGVFSPKFEFKHRIPCLDEDPDEMVFLKEMDDCLYFLLRSGKMFALNPKTGAWEKVIKPPISETSFQFVSDIIKNSGQLFVIDRSSATLTKFSTDKIIYRRKLLVQNPYKGFHDGTFLYLVSSERHEKGIGKLLKIRT